MDIDEISRELSSRLAYLQLMSSLDGTIKQPDVKTGLTDSWNFYRGTNATQLQSVGPRLIETLEPAINDYVSVAPPKTSIESIASDFNSLCGADKDLFSSGIEYRWLDERMDCSRMGLPRDLPWHARIGIGYHAGRASVEEEFLLRDAFFMLESAEESFAAMHAYAGTLTQTDAGGLPEPPKSLLLANYNVAAFSRLCIISFFSFIEAYVNSVGYDFRLRNHSRLTPEQNEMLIGRKKGRLISVEYKIEKFPSIIRADGRSPIVISDPAQLRDPFATFVQKVKTTRDSAVHYSPVKEAIWLGPSDWLGQARSASKLCVEVARAFWTACYPAREKPQYLNGLDYQAHVATAKERIKAKNDMRSHL